VKVGDRVRAARTIRMFWEKSSLNKGDEGVIIKFYACETVPYRVRWNKNRFTARMKADELELVEVANEDRGYGGCDARRL